MADKEPKGLFQNFFQNSARCTTAKARIIIWAWQKRWAFALITIILVSMLGVPLLWHWSAQRIKTQYPNISELNKAKLIEDHRRTLISGISTIATIVGAVVLIANLKDSQSRLVLDTDKSSREFKIAESRLVAERFSKAIEFLGDKDNESVQLGGIYSLEKIANDSPEYYWTILEILTAYVRRKSPLIKNRAYIKHPEISFPVQAALTSICRQRKSLLDDKDIINLGAINLTLANLTLVDRSANFTFCLFCNSNLYRATLNDLNLTHANFSGAFLYSADLRNSDLSYANFQLANLSYADLTGAILRKTNFDGAILCGTIFKDIKEYSSANWEGIKRFDEAIDIPEHLMKRLQIEGTLNENDSP